MVDLQTVYPEIILGVFALLLPAVRSLTKSDRATGSVALAGVGAALSTVLYYMWLGSSSKFGTTAVTLLFDPFVGLFMLVFLSVAFYVVLASIRFVQGDKHTGEFYTLILLATIGMMVVASSQDLITLFVGIELTSLSSYALVAFRKKDKRGAEAATKYFIIGGFSSAIALFGISLLYGVAKTVSFSGINAALAAGTTMTPVLLLSIVMLIAGFGFKVAIVPFHMWAPDVYEGAPTTITAMLASGSKKMGFVALFKVFLIGMIAIAVQWQLLIAIIAVATMTLGNLVAISQTNIKRMLAYSSIAQAGYILMSIPVAAVADPTIAQYALAGGIFQIITHSFMKGGAFIIVATLSVATLGESIADFKGLNKRAPFMAFAMMILMFSLAGIPPLAGFASKFVLFSAPINAASVAGSGNGWMLWLAVAAILNSALSLYYYARIVKYMYVDKGTSTERLKLPTSMIVAVAICVAAVILMGIYADPVIQACKEAAAQFFTYLSI
jgi:proton-translocating NADH-quinone oxidoreductase chain N